MVAVCVLLRGALCQGPSVRSSPAPPASSRSRPMKSPRLQSARRSARNLDKISLNERGSLRVDRVRSAHCGSLDGRGSLRRDVLCSAPSSSSRLRAVSPLRDDAFRKTPSQKAALTRVKMKIRGGGGSDEEVYRTPIKTFRRSRISGHDSGSFKRKKIEKSPILQRRHTLSQVLGARWWLHVCSF